VNVPFTDTAFLCVIQLPNGAEMKKEGSRIVIYPLFLFVPIIYQYSIVPSSKIRQPAGLVHSFPSAIDPCPT